MSNTGTFISLPDDQQGANPQLVTNDVPFPVSNYYLEVKKGNVAGHSITHKFGHGSAGATLSPVSNAGFYRTPTTAAALEFVSDSTDDDVGGTGATEITIQGLDANWEEVTQVINTNGTTVAPIPISMTRVYRWYVSESGTYAATGTVSHAGELTIQESGGGDVWSTITNTDPFPAQSEIGMMTIPKGVTGYYLSSHVFVDSNKAVSVFLNQRPNADDVTTPYSGTRRLLTRAIGVTGGYSISYISPKGPFIGPCDIGFVAIADAAADVSVEFEMLLVEDGH